MAALYYRAHEFVTDVLSTCISLVKLLTDLIEANKIAGLEVLMKEAIELVNLRKLSIERSLQMMRIKDNSLESIHKQIIILRYPPEPDMTIPLEAYGFSVNK